MTTHKAGAIQIPGGKSSQKTHAPLAIKVELNSKGMNTNTLMRVLAIANAKPQAAKPHSPRSPESDIEFEVGSYQKPLPAAFVGHVLASAGIKAISPKAQPVAASVKAPAPVTAVVKQNRR